jgi:hypothetical protein
MKPYGREKKVIGSGAWKRDYHVKKDGLINWWEDICDTLDRSRMKQIWKKEAKKEIEENLNAKNN